MPNTDLKNACVVAEKIRKLVEDNGIEVEGKKIDITVSLGLSELSENDDINTLIKRADTALYKAKETGRNRSVAYKDGKFLSCQTK